MVIFLWHFTTFHPFRNLQKQQYKKKSEPPVFRAQNCELNLKFGCLFPDNDYVKGSIENSQQLNGDSLIRNLTWAWKGDTGLSFNFFNFIYI